METSPTEIFKKLDFEDPLQTGHGAATINFDKPLMHQETLKSLNKEKEKLTKKKQMSNGIIRQFTDKVTLGGVKDERILNESLTIFSKIKDKCENEVDAKRAKIELTKIAKTQRAEFA